MVVLKWSRSSTANISYSSVLTKSIFDTKLYQIKIFLCFNKNHLHNNIRGLLGLTLTTIMPLKPNLTGLYSNTTKNMINCQLLDCQIPQIHFLKDFCHACHLAIISLTIPPRSNTMKDFLYNQQCHKPNQTTQASQMMHNEQVFINLFKYHTKSKNTSSTVCRIAWHNNVHFPSSTVCPCTKGAQSAALSTHLSRRPDIGNHEIVSFTYRPH